MTLKAQDMLRAQTFDPRRDMPRQDSRQTTAKPGTTPLELRQTNDAPSRQSANANISGLRYLLCWCKQLTSIHSELGT